MTDKNTNIDQALWTEKLGILDTTTYPWQTALLMELTEPARPGAFLKLHRGDRLRRQFPWEDHDSETCKVIGMGCTFYEDDDDFDEADDEALNLSLRTRSMATKLLKTYEYFVEFTDGSKATLPMVSEAENLHMLRYFFDKGVFSD